MSIAATEGTLPADIARVQFRLPEGGTARRSFRKQDKVEALYAYVESLVRVRVESK